MVRPSSWLFSGTCSVLAGKPNRRHSNRGAWERHRTTKTRRRERRRRGERREEIRVVILCGGGGRGGRKGMEMATRDSHHVDSSSSWFSRWRDTPKTDGGMKDEAASTVRPAMGSRNPTRKRIFPKKSSSWLFCVASGEYQRGGSSFSSRMQEKVRIFSFRVTWWWNQSPGTNPEQIPLLLCVLVPLLFAEKENKKERVLTKSIEVWEAGLPAETRNTKGSGRASLFKNLKMELNKRAEQWTAW